MGNDFIGLMEKELFERLMRAVDAESAKDGAPSREALEAAAQTEYEITTKERWADIRFEMSRDYPLISETDPRVIEAYREHLRDALDSGWPCVPFLILAAHECDGNSGEPDGAEPEPTKPPRTKRATCRECGAPIPPDSSLWVYCSHACRDLVRSRHREARRARA
jgi:hypothetical protein